MAKLEYSVVDGIFEQPSGKCFEVDTAAWWEWLESDEAKSFRFECDHGVRSYTARKEVIQSKGCFWYAYKKLDKRLHKSYIGKSPELTLERLDAIADTLGKPKSPQLHTELGNQDENELHTGELGNQDENELHTGELGNQGESEVEELRARILEVEQLNSELQAANQALEKQVSDYSQQLSEAKARINELHSLEIKMSHYESTLRDMHQELLTRPHPKNLIRKKVAELGMQEQLMQHQADSKKAVRYWALAKLLESLED